MPITAVELRDLLTTAIAEGSLKEDAVVVVDIVPYPEVIHPADVVTTLWCSNCRDEFRIVAVPGTAPVEMYEEIVEHFENVDESCAIPGPHNGADPDDHSHEWN